MNYHLVFVTECANDYEAQDLCLEYSLAGMPDFFCMGKKVYLKQKKFLGESMFFWSYEQTKLQPANTKAILDNPHTIIVDTLDKLYGLGAALECENIIAIDTETTGLNPWLDGLVGISIAWGINPYESAYIPIGHWVGTNLNIKEVQRVLNPIFGNKEIKKLFHNAKFDLKFLHLNGFNVEGLYFDSMIVHWIIFCHESSRHGLKEVINKFVAKTIEVPEFKDLMKEVPKGTKYKNIGDLPPERVGYYAGLDAVNTYHCFLGLYELLQKDNALYELWFNLELPVLNILTQMELYGLTLDLDWYGRKTIELSQNIWKLQQVGKVYKPNLNIGSTRQLNKFFFEECGLPTNGLTKNKTGYCLNKTALGYLSTYHPLAGLIVDFRHTIKMNSTYVQAPLKKLNKYTEKLHTEYKQIGTVTGRLSSTNPNSQNFPVEYREGIIASPGHILFAADYSGCEYRILSSLSNCKFLIEGYLNGYDAHTTVAKMIFPDKNPKEINPAWGKDYRFVGKQINFAIVYGKQPQNLASWIGIPLETVYHYYDIYWDKLNEVKQLMDLVHKTAVAKGYSKTILGRKRRYIFTDSFYTSQFGLPVDCIVLKRDNNPNDAEIFRQSFNAVIQGSNADITKLAMIACTNQIKKMGSQTKLILQIHDELVFEIPFEELEYMPKILVHKMENVYPFEVPLKVDYRIGYNWKSVKG